MNSVREVPSILDLPKANAEYAIEQDYNPNLELSGEYRLSEIVQSGPTSDSSKATVLVVDDLEDMRNLICAQLQRDGYQVVQAVDGSSALESAKAHCPDLLITDWMMPNMDGPALIKAWRSEPTLTGIPIVMLTARSDAQSKIESSERAPMLSLVNPFKTSSCSPSFVIF